MKKLMLATALVASAAAFADPAVLQAGSPESMSALNAISFEGYTAGDTFANGDPEKDEEGTAQSGNGYFFYEGDGLDGSSVKAFGGDNATAPNITRPRYFAMATPNANYLDLSTEGGVLWRSINAIIQGGTPEAPTYSLGNEKAIAADGIYLDTLVQFTPTEDGGTPEVTSDDKLVIWLNVDSSGGSPVTNLMVRAAYIDDSGTSTSATPSNFVVNTASPIVAGQWYRLTIKAIADATQCKTKNGEYNLSGITGFEIYLDGVQLAATTTTIGNGYIDRATDSGEYGWLDQGTDADFVTYLQSGKMFPSLKGETSTDTIQGIGFKGSGALDDIVWTEDDPFAAVALQFTLTWPAGVTPVSYTIGDAEGVLFEGTETSPLALSGVMSGTTVTFTFRNADGATKTMSLEAAANAHEIDASTATYEWADYLGDAVAGAYTIDDANDLDMLRKGVAANLATLGETFKQTANIDMTSEAAFAGIGTYASNLTKGVPFCGTYDGQGYKISNVTFTKRSYAGIFNQVKGGTIKDLTVENISFPELPYIVNTSPVITTNEYGGAIIGNAGLGATLLRLEAKGTFGSASYPATHNVAGIAVRVCGGASNVVNGVTMLETLVKDCTNSATLYGNYTKAGGITALTQDQNGVPNDYVKFEGCVNNGTITMDALSTGNTAGRDGLAGILAYVADGTKLENCVNNGTMTSTLTTAKIGGIIGWAQGRTLDDLGGNANPAAAKMIGDPAGSTITGFKYATVANNVATTVLPPLTVGATYLLEGAVGASDDTGVTLADGQTIAFDAALGYTFAGTVGAAAPLVAIPSTSGSVTTYTAGYFPRTSTAGQNGTSNPFELADADDLQALKAAFAANDAYKAYNYKVVNDIDATDLGYWDGIGVQGTANSGLKGVLDGGGYTISNLKFSAGKYRGFFNRMDGATIKDLTINVTDIQASGDEYGFAAFVGNMDSSKLLNCTATGTIGTTAKPAMHTCGGLAVKVNKAGVFVDCTNRINIVCALPDNPKVGGIVGLAQGAALTNCWNEGNLTIATLTCTNAANGVAGLIGYVQTNPVTIYGGGNAGTIQKTDDVGLPAAYNVPWKKDVNVASIIVMSSKAVTVSGGTVAQANMASVANRANISGLDFATVDGDVATFVADNALALNGSYKVMSAGATATFAFAEAGTIAFDTALFTPTYAITAAEGLTLTDATSGTVKTYTAAAPQPAYPTYLESADATIKGKYDTWKVTYGADVNSQYEAAFLLNADPQNLPVGAAYLKIASITQVSGGWELEIVSDAATLTAQNGTAYVGNGYLAIKYASDLATLASGGTSVNLPVTVTNGKITVTVTAEGAKFMKATLSTTPVVQQ